MYAHRIATVSLADRRALVELTALELVRLDGEPARIVGAACDYATIRSLTSDRDTTVAWEAARRRVAAGRRDFSTA